jgi:hypothetical protein
MTVNFLGATGVSGGAEGDLDAIDGSELSNGDGGFAVDAGAFEAGFFSLDSDAASSQAIPTIMKPDTNADDKRWILSTLLSSGLKIYEASTTNLIEFVGSSGNWVLDNKVDGATFTIQGENSGNSVILAGDPAGAATLYYAGAAKLATATGGVTVTGTLTGTTVNATTINTTNMIASGNSNSAIVNTTELKGTNCNVTTVNTTDVIAATNVNATTVNTTDMVASGNSNSTTVNTTTVNGTNLIASGNANSTTVNTTNMIASANANAVTVNATTLNGTNLSVTNANSTTVNTTNLNAATVDTHANGVTVTDGSGGTPTIFLSNSTGTNVAKIFATTSSTTISTGTALEQCLVGYANAGTTMFYNNIAAIFTQATGAAIADTSGTVPILNFYSDALAYLGRFYMAGTSGALQINGSSGNENVITWAIDGTVVLHYNGLAICKTDTASFIPNIDSTYTCGKSSHCWSNIYGDAGVSSCSDEKYKKDIQPTDLGLAFINDLVPVAYKFRKTGKRPKNHDRVYHGLLADDVEAVMQDHNVTYEDFAGLEESYDEDNDRWLSLKYEQFIAPLIKAVQELKAEVDLLKGE